MSQNLYVWLISALVGIIDFEAKVQLLTDTLAQKQIKTALNKIYNFEFASAETQISSIQK